MHTEEIKRRKTNTYYEMKTLGSGDDRDKVIEKLGISIYSSIDRLHSLKAKIISAHANDLKALISDFQREHNSFMEKQKSLMEVEEESEKIMRLKNKVGEFLSSFSTEEIEKKLEGIRDRREEQVRQSSMNSPQQLQTQMGHNIEVSSMRKKLLDEEDEQLKIIEQMMSQVKKIATETSQMILGLGMKLNIAADSIKNARLKMQAAKKELEETNTFQEDTAKKKVLFGALVCVILMIAVLLMIAARKK